MKKFKAVILALALTAFVAGGLWAADPKPQTTCPVLAGNIDKNVYADYQGKRIYFCCSGLRCGVQERPGKVHEKAAGRRGHPGTRPGRSS